MQYCEKCRRLVFEGEKCGYCDNKNLREVLADDYCFISQIGESQKDYFQDIVGEHVPCVFIPSGEGVRTHFAMRLEHYDVFVPYAFYDEVAEIFNDISDVAVSELKETVLKNLDKLFVENEKIAKKMCKKLKLAGIGELFDFIIAKINESDKFTDGGPIMNDQQQGRYVFVYFDGGIITLNSVTFEIISVD